MRARHLLILTGFALGLFSIITAQTQEAISEEQAAFKPRAMPKATSETPYISSRVHRNGRFWNTIHNDGIFGNYFGSIDEGLGRTAPNHYFPRYSRIRHGFYTGLWVGGIVDLDTLVSTSVNIGNFYWWEPFQSEFWPDVYPYGDFTDKVREINGIFGADPSKTEVIYEAVYTDTFQYEDFVPYSSYDQRYHKPLNLKVVQNSYSWSYQYSEDFVIIDYKLVNLGPKRITNAFVGFYHVGANHYTSELPYPMMDDLEGYIDSIPFEFEELGNVPMNISWTCDKDGHPIGGSWILVPTRNVFGIAPLALPEGADIRNFNWWIDEWNTADWGPRKRGTLEDPLRLFYGNLGRPAGDKSKYYMMSHPEVDYCGYEAARNHSNEGWLEPHEYAEDIANGHATHYLTSFGPFNIEPYGTQSVTMVFSIGENIHTNPTAYRDIFSFENPYPFMDYLDFSDLIDNVNWAKRIYDNPGVDTDGDGDSGKYFWHYDEEVGESLQVFYEGDGVPDFQGATPPPPPPIRVSAEEGKITIRWNGYDIERYFDTFSLIRDFEGYRVYLALSEDEFDISLLATYDREDYNRYVWDKKRLAYNLLEVPFTLDSLRGLYGEDFEPLEYTRVDPLYDNGSVYFFTKVDYNTSDLSDPHGIHKLYSDAIPDTSDVDEEGRIRYYEYEYVIKNLLPTVPYWVSVTSFDFGYPAKSLESMESSPQANMVKVFALDQYGTGLEDNKLNVYCYPNPYRVDASYTARGFENRFNDLATDRARNIYFANLPNKCTISIYSLDGDLVRRFEHDEPFGSGESSVARYDLITRNTQAIVSGLYYWVVESEYGNQIGKLVIIK